MNEKMFPDLFSPLTIRGKTFKNRILLAPKGYPIRDKDRMEQSALDFYERLARGGAARVNTGECDVEYGSAVAGMWNMFLDPLPDPLAESAVRYAANCHRYGALAFMHFGHMGAYARDRAYIREMQAQGLIKPFVPPFVPEQPKHPDGTPYEPVLPYGPSELVMHEPWDGLTTAVLYDGNDAKRVREMTRARMEEVADAFARCARNAKKCGMDGISIHSGHGFIFSQWISPRFNHRTDEFGGSMENRARFPILCLQRIRDAVGEDFLVELRFSAEERVDAVSDRVYLDGLVTLDDTVAFFRELDRHPGLLDIAHISGGLHFVPYYNIRTIPNSFYPAAPNLEAAARVKAAVTTIKVGCVGAMGDPQLCQDAIAGGKVDFVFMARQLCVADPEFPNKAGRGEPEMIDNCLRCTVCKQCGTCAVNPIDVNSPAWDGGVPKTAAAKRVVVVGGGIAGMKAAEFAARAGHSVTLLEKTGELGGILRYAEHDRFKTEIRRYRHAVAARIGKLGVDIRLNTQAGPELVRSLAPDAVFFAAGGKFNSLAIPGGDTALNSLECYLQPERVGQRVAIIGGGLTGVEASVHLGAQGKTVTLVSRSEKLAPRVKMIGPANGNIDTQLIWLDKLGVDIRVGCAASRVVPDGLFIKDGAGVESFVPADTVVNTTGLSENAGAADAFRDIAPLTLLGDCLHPAYIGDAVAAACRAVLALG